MKATRQRRIGLLGAYGILVSLWWLGLGAALAQSDLVSPCGDRAGTPPGLPAGWLCDPDGPLVGLPSGWDYARQTSTHVFTGNYSDRQSGAVVEFRVGPRQFFGNRPCKRPRGGTRSKDRIKGVRYCKILVPAYREFVVARFQQAVPDFAPGDGKYPDLEASLPHVEDQFMGVTFLFDELIYSFDLTFSSSEQRSRTEDLLLGEFRLNDHGQYPKP